MVWVQIRQCSVEGRGDVLLRPAGRCLRAFPGDQRPKPSAYKILRTVTTLDNSVMKFMC